MDTVSNYTEIMELLWNHYSDKNPLEDPQVKTSEQAIKPIFEELDNKNSDRLFMLIYDLCNAYQRNAFLEGVRIGAAVSRELGNPSQAL